MATLIEKLSAIQNEMNVPKNLYNKFGNYYYRNAETILETAKPLCKKYKTTLIVEDEIVCVENRFYVKAIACLYDWESKDIIRNCAFAREEEHKKGMDSSQVTGSCSSYARKYALNGLFNLDDVKDADSNEYKEENGKRKDGMKATPKQIEILAQSYQGENLSKLLNINNIQKLEDISKEKATELISKLMNSSNGDK